MSSSAHIDNKTKNILVLGKGPTQGLEHTLTAEKMYSINFTVTKRKFCLSLYYSGADSYLFVNGKEFVKFNANDSAIVVAPLCLGNISRGWSVNNMTKTGLNGYVYEFIVDYEPIDSSLDAAKVIPNLHDYFIAKYKIKQNVSGHKKCFFIGSAFSTSVNPLSCISMANNECKIRPEIVNVNSNEPVFYPFSIKTSKCSGSCYNIDEPYAKNMCS